jgi:hypothetical protein
MAAMLVHSKLVVLAREHGWQLAGHRQHDDVYGIAALRALPEAVFGQHDRDGAYR